MKRFFLLMTVLFVAIVFFGCNAVHSFSIPDAEYVEITSGVTGTFARIEDAEDVEEITDDFNHLSLKKGEFNETDPDWAYRVEWFNEEMEPIAEVEVISPGMIEQENREYYVVGAAIDLQELEALIAQHL